MTFREGGGAKPTLYASGRLPLGELSPEDFERFVAAVFGVVAGEEGLDAVEKPSGPTDEGFDIRARRASDGGLVCIQCKHLRKDALSLPVVALELAKVALQGAIEPFDIVQHRFVTSSKVNKELESALRERDRNRLVDEALRLLRERDELAFRRQRVEERGHEPASVVADYVRRVDIRAWSGEQLHTRCQMSWSRLTDVIERFFTLETVLREHPRPDFDEPRYLAGCQRSGSGLLLTLRGRKARLPTNVRLHSSADPRAPQHPSFNEGPRGAPPPLLEVVLATRTGECTLLTGAGGAGKSTTLQMACALAAERRSEDPDLPLPIRVELGRYRGRLEELIGSSLRVRHGHWTSLPGDFLLLCDGLNEVRPEDLQQLGAELEDLLTEGRVKLVLTVRSEGMRRPFVLPRITRLVGLAGLTMQDVVRLATDRLPEQQRTAFLDELRARVNTDIGRVLELPFGLATALSVFQERNMLPGTEAELIELVLRQRFQRNQELTGPLPDPLPELPYLTLRAIAEELAFSMRFTLCRSTVDQQELGRLIRETLRAIQQRGVVGAEELSPLKVEQFLHHYELLSTSPDGWVGFSHDLILDFLASRPLVRDWRRRTGTLRSSLADDAWIFASPEIPPAEQEAFLRELAASDLVLAMRCGKAMGPTGMDLAEQVLTAQLDGSVELFPSIQRIMAMGELGTPYCIAILRAFLADPSSIEASFAESALATAGDERFLRELLEEAEQLAEQSTQEQPHERVALWEDSLCAASLRLARERLARFDGQQPVRMSMRTVAQLGDFSDVPALERVLETAPHWRTTRLAFHCLHRIDASRAFAKLEGLLSRFPPVEQFYLREALAKAGGRVDATWLVDFILAWPTLPQVAPQEEARRSAVGAQLRAILLLKKTRLTPDLEQRYLKALEENHQGREELWLLAPCLPLKATLDLALKTVPVCSASLLRTITFFVLTPGPDDRPERAALLDLVRQRMLKDESIRDSPAWQQVLFLLLRTDREFVAREISNRLTHLLTALPPEPLKQLSALLPIAVPVADLLPKSTIRGLLGLDIAAVPAKGLEKLADLLHQLDDAELNASVRSLPTLPRQLCLLGQLLKRQVSPERLELLRDLLPAGLASPVALPHLREALTHLRETPDWRASIASMVVEAIAQVEWEASPEPGLPFDFLDDMAAGFDEHLARTLIAPLLFGRALHPNTSYFLRYWYDSALGRRE